MSTHSAVKLRNPFALAASEIIAISGRERTYLTGEMDQFRGFLPLLTRSFTGKPLTPLERAQLRAHLRRLSTLSPYFAVILLPGALVALPFMIWWRDRHRNRLLHRAARGNP